MNWIQHIAEPRQLFLAWQAPDHLNDRFRWAVGVLTRIGSNVIFRYLRPGLEFQSYNQGRNFEELFSLGYASYPAFPWKREVHSVGVIDIFMRRLPPHTRSDFEAYREQFRLHPQVKLSNFALLGLTEAKLPSDGFSLVDPLDEQAEYCDLLLEVAGLRYYVQEGFSHSLLRQDVELLPEPDNQYDRHAVKVTLRGKKIGNINRLQAPTFLYWFKHRAVSACIERLNGNLSRPRAFLFIQVRPLHAMAD